MYELLLLALLAFRAIRHFQPSIPNKSDEIGIGAVLARDSIIYFIMLVFGHLVH